MKKLLLCLLGLSAAQHIHAQTAGDLAVILTLGGASNTPDRFRVVVLAPIPANTVFTFTDNNWDGNTLATSEGNLVWTSPNSVLPKGTIIAFDASATTFTNGGTVSTGTITSVSNNLFNFTSLDDNLFVYLGTTPPTTSTSPLWIWGINGRAWGTAGTGSANFQPTALLGYSVAMVSPTNGRNADFYYANGTNATSGNVAIPGATKGAVLMNITNNSLYYRNDVSSSPTTAPIYPTYSATVLPLRLLSFTAETRNGRVLATWATANEEQVARMELQRSADGRAFETVAAVKGTNENGQHSYTAADDQPLAGRSYYRLAMQNTDGSAQYSETVAMLAVTKEQTLTLQATPNPVHHAFALLHSAAGANARLTVRGVDGRLVATRQPVAGTTETDFSDIDLPAGSYIACFENDGQKITTLLVK